MAACAPEAPASVAPVVAPMPVAPVVASAPVAPSAAMSTPPFVGNLPRGTRLVASLVLGDSVGTFEGFAGQVDLILEGPNGFHQRYVAHSYTNLHCDWKAWPERGSLAPPGPSPLLGMYCMSSLNHWDDVIVVVRRGDSLVPVRGTFDRDSHEQRDGWFDTGSISLPPGVIVEAKR